MQKSRFQNPVYALYQSIVSIRTFVRLDQQIVDQTHIRIISLNTPSFFSLLIYPCRYDTMQLKLNITTCLTPSSLTSVLPDMSVGNEELNFFLFFQFYFRAVKVCFVILVFFWLGKSKSKSGIQQRRGLITVKACVEHHGEYKEAWT